MSAPIRVPWLERYEELKKYKEKHGDCNVPKKHGPLGQWVATQRKNYRLLKAGKKLYSSYLIQKLELIGFQWSLGHGKLENKRLGQLWDAQFQELKKYKEKHENCSVLLRHGTLGRWVGRQRTNYRLLKEGKPSPMSDDRIQKLESIGFQWSCYRQRDSSTFMQVTTNNTASDAKSGHMSSFGSASATATDDQSSSHVLFEDSHTDDLAVASPVVSCERHVVDSSKITCDEAPEFRPFLLGTGYC